MSDEDGDPLRGDPPARPLLSVMFWLALLAALVCIAGGGVVAVFGPRLFPVHAGVPMSVAPPR